MYSSANRVKAASASVVDERGAGAGRVQPASKRLSINIEILRMSRR